jgi:hypothetical protein
MALTYSQFVTQLSTWLVIDPANTDFLTAVPMIIDFAEQELYRELDLLDTVVRDTSATLTANSRNFTFPQHIVVSESMNVFTPTGTTTHRNALTPVSREWLDAIWGDEAAPSTPSVPQYYAMITDQTIIVGPAPDAAYTMELIGTIRPTPLSPTTTSTYLSLYLPDLFFCAAQIAGYGYMKDFGAAVDDPQGSITWVARYKDLWQSASAEEQRKKYMGPAWTPKSPTPLATPPRA